MQKMTETPIIFVTYPVGAGGWFLASLLYSTYTNTTELIRHNARGSGHANTEISKLNNWYISVQDSTIQDILYQKNIDSFSSDQRIEYLRNTLIAAPQYTNNMTHVISLHCQDLNLFLKAFPNSKAIIIDITKDDVDKCVFNYIYKVLSLNLKYFETLCKRHNRKYLKYVNFLQNIDLESLKNLQWISKDIEMTIPIVPIEDVCKSRTMNLNYQNYIGIADPHELVLQLNNFLKTSWSSSIINTLVNELVLYRLKQPPYPII
jgi:hypothetical protein